MSEDSSFELVPLDGFGREVRGLSLWEPVSTESARRLADAWSEHGLLLMRRQALSEDELVAFSSLFGDLDVIVREDWQSQSRPEVIQITNEETMETSREVAASDGILVGISAGAALAAAREIARRPEARGKRIVVIIPSFGERYLSTALFADQQTASVA